MAGEQRLAWYVAGRTGSWMATHQVETVAMVALYANPTTRTWVAKSAWMLGKETLRFTGRVAVRSATLTYSELIAGSRMAAIAGPVGVYASAVAGGILLGSIVGTGVAYLGWGAKGASDAVELYSGQVSWAQYKRVVGGAFS